MSDAPEPTPRPTAGGSKPSLGRALAGGLAVVVVSAAAFWGIGTLTGDDTPTPVAGDAPGDATDDGAGVDGAEPTEPGDGAADDADGAGDGEPDDGAADDADGSDADGSDADGADGDGSDGVDGSQDPGDDEGTERTVEPSEVTVQVLDGFKSDGGAAADGVADLLGGEGYDIIARNDALDYPNTAVLYNPGNEEAAAQIAAELGGAEVREQPGTLSTSVAIHVVVGADRG